jgi:ribonuclease J
LIPLGGVEEIGKNMTVIEYKDEIIIIDAGFQFTEEDTPGVDFIIPNVEYLEKNKDKVKALFITHGHYDHIGAIPYIMGKIGNPPIYSMKFGAAIIQKRQLEFPDTPTLDMHLVEGHETVTVGKYFTVQFFDISHAIPDSMGIIVNTPNGRIVTVSDVRVDHIDGIPTEKEVAHYAPLKDLDVVLFMLDSTSIEKPGFSRPESLVIKTVDGIIKDVPGRLIIGTFASQVERVIEFIRIAEKYNKKVIIDGRSMKTNVEIIKQLDILKLANVIPIEEIDAHAPNKIVVIATGAQGEQYSVLDRIGNSTHRYIRLAKSDTVLLSSSIIPGNEFPITKLKDNLYRHESKIITYLDSDVHASGHGNRGELEWIHKQINYKYFMPMHGHHYMLRIHAELAQSLGKKDNEIIVPDNGSVIDIQEDGTVVKRKEKVMADPIMVEGFSVGGMQDVVIRDRQTLAKEGIFIIVASVNQKTGKLRKSPDILSRGFVYIRESQELFGKARTIIKKTIEDTTANMNPIDFDYLREAVTEKMKIFLFQETAKRPIIMTTILGV